jgi:hypothetical protein
VVRHRRQSRRKRTCAWPTNITTPDDVAAACSYVGSAEHKDHPSPAGAPRLRSDASPCDPRYASLEEPTGAMRAAIRAGQISELQGRFPKYVWGLLDGRLYEARLVDHELGQYKAYPLRRDDELPEDPLGALDAVVRAWTG